MIRLRFRPVKLLKHGSLITEKVHDLGLYLVINANPNYTCIKSWSINAYWVQTQLSRGNLVS